MSHYSHYAVFCAFKIYMSSVIVSIVCFKAFLFRQPGHIRAKSYALHQPGNGCLPGHNRRHVDAGRMVMQPLGQCSAQAPQPTHSFSLSFQVLVARSTVKADAGHFFAHSVQNTH